MDTPPDLLDSRLVAARPEIDAYVHALLHMRVRSELFGTADPVRIGRYDLLRHLGSGGGGSVFAAWDSELTREVAIKLVVAPESQPEWRQRALAEGQALAQLSHPNVVPVFDVGTVSDRVYLVMELVRGTSLRNYARTARRHDIVRAYRQCALGLAAAHAAHLVHRDFKPDNAVISDDGRVRVIDFGLSLPSGAEAEGAGTPRYMAPEQIRGELLTPAVDQYALAVALSEALGTPTGKLGRVLARAAATDSAARYPSLNELEEALARFDPTVVRRRRLTAVTAVLGVAATAFAVGQARTGDEPCAYDGSAGIWTPVRRAEVAAHIASLGTAYAASAVSRLTTIDRFAATWAEHRRAACVAHRASEISADHFDRRQHCLASAKTQLAELARLGTTVAADGLAPFVTAMAELPNVASCADAPTVVPPSLAQTAGVRALRERLDRARVQVHAGAANVPALSGLVADARALDYLPVLGDALLLLGTAHLHTWELEAAEPPLREAYAVKLRGGDYGGAIEAFARHLWVRGLAEDAPLRALSGIEVVAPLAESLSRQARFAQALLHNNIGSIYLAAGDSRALGEFVTSRALGLEVKGPGAIEIAVARFNLGLVTEDPVKRQTLFSEYVEIQSRALGPDHPNVLWARAVTAQMTPRYEHAAAVLAPPCHRLIALHPSHRQQIAECGSQLGWLELVAGNLARAREDFALAPDDHLAQAFAVLANGNRAIAAQRFRPLTEVPEHATWNRLFESGQAELGLGMALTGGAAQAAFARGRAVLERALSLRPLWAPIRWRLDWLSRR